MIYKDTYSRKYRFSNMRDDKMNNLRFTNLLEEPLRSNIYKKGL